MGSSFMNSVTKKVSDINWLDSTRKKQAEFHEAMEQLHKEVAATSAKKRRQEHDRQAKSKTVQVQKIAVGDILLVGHVSRQGNKLSLHWRGPSKIVWS